MTAFSHLDTGTSEALWRDELERRDLRPLDLEFDALVVVAAHPDDETLGAGGLLCRASRLGVQVVVVIATDGEASHPHSPTHDRETLARLRRAEVREAVEVLAPRAEVRFLGLADGALDRARDELFEGLRIVLDQLEASDSPRLLVAVPWAQDRHRDHRVASEVTTELASAQGIVCVEYPVWAWHWGTPADLPWERVVSLSLTEDERRAKHAALASHTSQTRPLSDQPGDEAVLHAAMQAHFLRAVEIFLTAPVQQPSSASLDAQWFEEFYDRNGDDPWGFESRWYEQRKRALLMATLPARQLGDVFEIGCATGLVTIELADRARTVLAMDAAAAPVAKARARLQDNGHVSVRQGSVPADWPAGRFDTIVLSEVGYYLSRRDRRQTLTLIDDSLADDGCLVACHWRHPVADYPQTGDEVHEAIRAFPAWEAVSLHIERDFVLEVFARRPARSVAEREGLV